MFPSRVSSDPVVAAGLPSLLQEMDEAGIDNPRRMAAFLATLAHESAFEYDVKQHASTLRYAGRGYIQLTGVGNYTAAGKYFGIDLVNNPDLALSLEWSAKIARWYWTVNRHCNELADQLLMGKVNAAIGYPPSDEDGRRCESFKKALNYLTGETPTGVSCAR